MNEIVQAEIVAGGSGVLVGALLTLAASSLCALLRQRRLNRCLRDGHIIRGIRP